MARTAGRGGLAISAAKIYFILLGLVQQVLLPRVLGTAGYGALSRVLSPASIAYNPLVTTSIQGVSRAVAQSAPADRPATIRRVLGVHALLAVPIAAAFFLLAPYIARWVNAEHLEPGLRILSGVLLVYGLYAPLIGVLNGTQRFVGQAALDALAATLRSAALVLGGWLGVRTLGSAVSTLGAAPAMAGVQGACLGFVVAASVVLLVAVLRVGVGRAGQGGIGARAHLAFVAPLAVGQIFLNVLLQADLTLLGRFAGDAAERAGLAPAAADPLVGAYRATQLFSFLPYQLLIAVTFILFPLLAKAHKEGNREAVGTYVSTGVRLALVLMGLMVSVTSSLSGPLLGLVYGANPEVRQLGSESMQLLSLGFGAFALFGIFVTVLNSLGREVESTLVTGVAALAVVVGCAALVPGTPFGPALLWRTAIATSLGLAVATSVAAWRVHVVAGRVAPLAACVRVCGSLAVTITVGRWIAPTRPLLTLVAAAALALLYLLLLVVTRELGAADLANLKQVLRRRA